jgi:hypothetical protein
LQHVLLPCRGGTNSFTSMLRFPDPSYSPLLAFQYCVLLLALGSGRGEFLGCKSSRRCADRPCGVSYPVHNLSR